MRVQRRRSRTIIEERNGRRRDPKEEEKGVKRQKQWNRI